MLVAKTLALFVVTALAEIIGCYLPWLWLKKGAPGWVLLPAAGSKDAVRDELKSNKEQKPCIRTV